MVPDAAVKLRLPFPAPLGMTSPVPPMRSAVLPS
jgi:hypothetical protein